MVLRNKLNDTTRKLGTKKKCKNLYRTNDLVSPENQFQEEKEVGMCGSYRIKETYRTKEPNMISRFCLEPN